MIPIRVSVFLFLASLAATAGLLVWAAGVLPESVASHFDITGTPDGWSDRSGYLTFHAFLIGSMAALFGGFAWVAPKVPDSLVNLSNKEYWLAPERREQTMTEVRSLLLFIGTITVAFIALLLLFNVWAHQEPGDGIASASGVLRFWGPFAAYMIAMIWIVIHVLIRQSRMPND